MRQVSDKGILARIKEIRNIKGFSQEYVGSKLKLGQSGYALIENGRNELTVNRLLQIAIILEVGIVDLVGYPFKYIKQEEMDENMAKLQSDIKTKDKLIEQYEKNQIKDENEISQIRQEIQKLKNELSLCQEEKKEANQNSKSNVQS